MVAIKRKFLQKSIVLYKTSQKTMMNGFQMDHLRPINLLLL